MLIMPLNSSWATEQDPVLQKERKDSDQAWWLTPVIQHFGRLRWVDHLRSGVQDQPGQHGETLSLLKIQKSARCGGTRL